MLCWIELKLCVCDYFGIKIEFWFGDVNEIQIDWIICEILVNCLGWVVLMEKYYLMIGVFRFDGVYSVDNLVEVIIVGVMQIVFQYIEQVFLVWVLLECIYLYEFDLNLLGLEFDYCICWEILIGLCEMDLMLVYCYMYMNLYLLIFGVVKLGKMIIVYVIVCVICV